MKKLFQEFKEFISKGNIIDLAVGVIIGAAFKSIVDSLVHDIISPLIGLVADTHLENLTWQFGSVNIGYGAFITAIINFVLMAVVLFLIIKLVESARKAGQSVLSKNGDAQPAAPTTKICPYCKSEVPIDATRCAFCTSELKTAQ
ncbi:MAG: large conductance mechanosensitive channel protein MscL [Oscillospiraceae bacterium]